MNYIVSLTLITPVFQSAGLLCWFVCVCICLSGAVQLSYSSARVQGFCIEICTAVSQKESIAGDEYIKVKNLCALSLLTHLNCVYFCQTIIWFCFAYLINLETSTFSSLMIYGAEPKTHCKNDNDRTERRFGKNASCHPHESSTPL